MAERPKRGKLTKVTIGPYIPARNKVLAVDVKYKSTDGRPGGLKDPAMGFVRKKGEMGVERDFAKSIGRMGSIAFSEELLSSTMRDALLTYLAVFKYDHAGKRLEMKDGLIQYAQKYRELEGFRKLKYIAKEASPTNPWKKAKDRLDSVYWSPNTNTVIPVSSSDLKSLLADATSRYRRSVVGNRRVSIEDLGVNLDNAKPEDWVSGIVPVLPNIFRMGNKYQETHPYDILYQDIISAKIKGDTVEFSKAYMNLVKKNPGDNLVADIFTANKKGFIRGTMYSKVGGQIGRSVVAPDPSLRPDQIGVPRVMAQNISRRMLLVKGDKENLEEARRLIELGEITHIFDKRSGEFIHIQKEHIATLGSRNALLLRQLTDGDVTILGRQPSLHKNSMLGGEVVIHDKKCIYVHPSMSKGFAMDFDGDEGNLTINYSQEGENEIRQLMFATWNMASIASSSLIQGYHQDINLSAYILSLEGTFLDQESWTNFAQLIWEHSSRGGILSSPYDDWISNHIERCVSLEVEPLSGRSLFSLLLPPDMEWKYGSSQITKGILVSGIVTEKIASASPSSIGMNLYRTYGPKYTMSWLNSSYQFLGRYIRWRGATLGFPDLQISTDKQKEVQSIIERGIQSTPKEVDLGDTALNNRRETDIIDHLGNIRDTIAVAILGEKDPKNVEVETLILKINNDTLSRKKVPLRFPVHLQGDEVTLTHGTASIDTQQGYIRYKADNITYVWSMAIFPEAILNGKTYKHNVKSLKSMIDSGARGNSISATQIAGIVGSLTYSGGRMPLMMKGGSRPEDFRESPGGRRSMPVYPFGTNTPQARGFITPSYLKGIGPVDYMAAHVASRENLTANTSLTPMTGYFGRSMRVFLENLQIDYISGKQVVINERGVLVSVNYLLDPGKTFAIDNKYTFVDVKYELRQIRKKTRSETALYVKIPYRTDYLVYDEWLHTLKKVDRDIIISIDPRTSQDYYLFLKDILPTEIGREILVVRSSTSPSLFHEYKEIIVIPVGSPITTSILENVLPEGVSARLGVTMKAIPSIKNLYPLILGITDIYSIPMIIRPRQEYKLLLKSMSLMEAILSMGNVLPM